MNMEKHELLIEKDQFQIDWHNELALNNATALQRVHELYPIENETEAIRLIAQTEKIIRVKMETHHKKYLGAFDPMTLTMPDEILRLKNSLEILKGTTSTNNKQLPGVSGFQFVRFSNGEWMVNRQSLDEYCERFYRYADPLKFEVGNAIAEALNKLPFEFESQKIQAFKTIATIYDPIKKVAVPDMSFLRSLR